MEPGKLSIDFSNILAVDWATEFDSRSINDYFLFLVSLLQSLIDICSNLKTGSRTWIDESFSTIFSKEEGCKVKRIQTLESSYMAESVRL